MKKRILLYLAIVLIFTSCSSETNRSEFKESVQQDFHSNNVLLEFTGDNYVNPMIITSKEIFYEEYGSDNGTLKFAKLDLSDKTTTQLPNIELMLYSDGRIIDFGGGDYLASANYDPERIEVDNIVRFNFEKNIEEIIYTWEHNVPISRIDLIEEENGSFDKNNIILTYRENDGVEITYYFDIFNLNTKESKNILTKKYNQENNTGESPYETLVAHSKNIIILNQVFNDSGSSYTIEEYTTDGELIRSYAVDLSEFLDLNETYGNDMKDFIQYFYKFNDIFVLITKHNRVCMYRESGDSLIELELPENFDKPLYFLANEQANADDGYLYFMSADSELNILDLNKMEVTKKKITFDNESLEPLYVYINKDGGVILMLSDIMASKDTVTYQLHLLES